MLSSLWNQIANADSDSSEDESFPSKSAPLLHEDDIAAASLLTVFPSYGSQRKMAALDSSSSNNINGPSSVGVSPLVSGDWEFSPKRLRKNDPGSGGLLASDEFLGSIDDDSTSHSTAVSGGAERKKNGSPLGERQVDVVVWSKAESEIWSDSENKSSKSKRFGRYRKDKTAESMYFNAELRRQWIHGKNVTSTGGMHGRQESKEKESTKRTYKRQHFTFEDDATINTEGSNSSDDDRSAIVKSDLLKDHLDEKSHWMPDVLCKQCYACEAQFTVFRRRHHCRLCGQVFCSRCSSCFVEIVGGRVNQNQLEEQHQQTDDVRTIRTCKVCYELVSSTGPNGFSFYNSNGGHDDERIGLSLGNGEDSKETQVGNIRSFSRMEEDKTAPSSQVAGFQGGPSGDFFNLALVKQKLEEDRVRREKEEQSIVVEEKESTSPNPIKSITRRFGRLAESAAREAQVGHTGYNDEETKLIGTGVRNTEDSESPQSTKRKVSSKTFDDSVLSLPPEGEEGGASSANDKKRHAEAKKNSDRQLRLTAADYLENMGRELMRSDAPTLLNELNMKEGSGPVFDKWVSKLMMLATKACSSVKVDIRNGDALDILPYCKVKGEEINMLIFSKWIGTYVR